jgi:DNA mismatch repair protein MutS
MLEAKNAIANATNNSLILFDEIGRGTSTYDGMALAQAIIEYIHDNIGAKTLFSTHYHELTILENELDRLSNIHVSAMEQNGKVVFLHKIKEGPTDKSYGIHVAKLAELPDKLIDRANQILISLEKQDNTIQIDINNHTSKEDTSVELKSMPSDRIRDEQEQLSFFGENSDQPKKIKLSLKEKNVLEKLRELDILEMTPIQAMNILYSLHKNLK